MGGTMIKNLIIIGLFAIVFTQTDIGIVDIFDYIQMGLDKVQEIVYTMKRSV
jgi:outer membrane lipoprotein-sorting protein